MLALFLSAIEVTVVGTAMPTIISQLGGLSAYSWVFSVYSLSSTVMTPIFGKLSDQFGRRSIFLIGMTVFLVGSMLSGLAQSMPQLIFFRALQGLGAGALIPLSFTIVGEIYTIEQRARVQGVLSSVWGVASLIGPLVGGFLVEKLSWHWVFYFNVPFCLLAMALLHFGLQEPPRDRTRSQIDFAGASLLIISVVSLLLSILEGGQSWAWVSAPTFILLGLFVGTFVWLLRVERRAAEPILALSLFKDPLVKVAAGHGFLAGLALFGSAAFVPLFAQAVLGASPTAAGAALTPQILGWTFSSTLGAPYILRYGYRRVSVTGMIIMTLGALLLSLQGPGSTPWIIGLSQVLFGGGMGLTITTMVIAIQNRVARTQLGTATSMMSFMRTIGGSVGVSIMGAVMVSRLTTGLTHLPPGITVTPEQLLDPIASREITPAALEAIRGVLAAAIQPVFLIALIASCLALVVVLFTPRGSVQDLAARPKPQAVGANGE